MSFFDTTPTGRIMNRFSKDVDTLDVNIPFTLRILVTALTSVIGTIIVISYSTPIFLSVVLPLGLLYYFAQVTDICKQLIIISSIIIVIVVDEIVRKHLEININRHAISYDDNHDLTIA